MTYQTPETPTKQENYVPKMKPGDVEIPNRVFVKGFPREATADDLFTFFEEYGQVLECRIVADRSGYSKGFGFVTFDSQNVAEKVKALERIKYNEEIEVVIGPARIRKKKYYLVPAPQWNVQPQMYPQDGNVVWTSHVPQSPTIQPAQMMSPVPVQMQMMPQQGTPVILVNGDSPPYKQTQQQCVTYQAASPLVNVVEKVPITNRTAICSDDSQLVPTMSPPPTGYVDVQQSMTVPEAIIYSPAVVPVAATQKRMQ